MVLRFLDRWWGGWHYKNTTLLVLSIFFLFLISGSSFAQTVLSSMGNLGYAGAYLSGLFFVFVFTVAPAAVVLGHLSDLLNPFWLAIVAGIGSVTGDFLIFRFFKDKIFAELQPLIPSPGKMILKLFKTHYFNWIPPLVGAIIIASPLPDEVGVSLMGLSKIRQWQFIIISFLLNTLGILLVIGVAKIF